MCACSTSQAWLFSNIQAVCISHDSSISTHEKEKQNNSARATALQITLALALISLSAMLLASSLSQPAGGGPSPENLQPDKPMPDVVRLVGAVLQNQDLRSLPYVAPNAEIEEKRLTRYAHPEIPNSTNQSDFPRLKIFGEANHNAGGDDACAGIDFRRDEFKPEWLHVFAA